MKLVPGRVAVVTGAASGIGRELARQLAGRGLTVAMTDIEREPLAEAHEQVTAAAAQGANVIAVPADVADPDSVGALAGEIRERLGPVALLCNNAGVVGPRRPLWEQSRFDFGWVLGVNLWGVINGLAAFLPDMVRSGNGHVLNTASVAALAVITGGGNGPYAASKHAVAGLSEVLAEDLREVGIDVGVTVLCPGPVKTNIRSAARNRPASLSSAPLPDGTAPPTFSHAVPTISAESAARVALEAVEKNQFWALTNPGNEQEVRIRAQQILADCDLIRVATPAAEGP